MIELNSEQTLPLLLVSNSVLFPAGVMSILTFGASRAAVLKAGVGGVMFVALRRGTGDGFSDGDTHRVGTLCRVFSIAESADGLRVVVHGVWRANLHAVEFDGTVPRARGTPFEPSGETPSAEHVSALRGLALRWYAANPAVPRQARAFIESLKNPVHLVDLLAANILETPTDKQIALETTSVMERYDRLVRHLEAIVARLERDAPPPLQRAWIWWSRLMEHPKFNGWAAAAIVAACAAVAVAWIRVHYPPAPPVDCDGACTPSAPRRSR